MAVLFNDSGLSSLPGTVVIPVMCMQVREIIYVRVNVKEKCDKAYIERYKTYLVIIVYGVTGEYGHASMCGLHAEYTQHERSRFCTRCHILIKIYVGDYTE